MPNIDDVDPDAPDANDPPEQPYELDDYGNVIQPSNNNDGGVEPTGLVDSIPPPPPPPKTTMTPDEWKELLFSITGEYTPQDAWKHGAAEALHDWKGHEHHQGAKIQLSREDYVAALEAATKTDDKGAYAPHDAAIGSTPARDAAIASTPAPDSTEGKV